MSFINTKIILNDNFHSNVINQFKCVDKDLNLIKRPETYLTLLKEDYGNNSKTITLKRKMNKLRKYKVIYDENIPSRNGRSKLFFVFDKNYYIIITFENVYYCNEIVYTNNKLIMKGSYLLNKYNWKSLGIYEIDNKEVIKCF